MRKILSIIAAAAVSGLATPALAADTLYLDTQHTPFYSSGDRPAGTSLLFSINGVNVRASAWSIGDDGRIHEAQLGVWSGGLGVRNGRNDNTHTVDNSGYLDFLLFQFDEVVELDLARFNTGWDGISDTDATIGYTLSGLDFGTLPGWDGQLSSVLSPLNLYSNNYGSTGSNERDINPNDYTGNMWLIGASFNNPSEGSYYKQKKAADGFKLEYLTFTRPPPGVPEPSTWAMLLVGFFGLGGAMRSAKRRQLEGQADALSAA